MWRSEKECGEKERKRGAHPSPQHTAARDLTRFAFGFPQIIMLSSIEHARWTEMRANI